MSAVLEFTDRQFLQRVYRAVVDPVVGDDVADGFLVGDAWYNTATGNAFDCHSNAAGAAVWRHRPRVLGQGSIAAHTGDTAETLAVAVLVPAGSMGLNGRLDIKHGWANNNSGNAKTRRIRFGAAANLTGTIFHEVAPTTNVLHNQLDGIVNDGSASVQLGDAIAATATQIGAFATASVGGTINTGNASYVVFSGQLANGGDSIRLQSYRVTLTRPDIGP